MALVVAISWFSLRNPGIDDLDSAHHLMDGYFFRDLFVAHPVVHIASWSLNYYKQYPALGFIFWPPLFPFVLGLFCVAGGPHVLTGRICMLCFGFLFGVSFYAILRRQFSVWLSLAAVCSAITVPGLARSFNQLMLELPTLAVMCVAVLAYYRLIDHLPDATSKRRALLCAVACAAVVYTKQPAWFLYPVLAFHFLLLHRSFLRKREVWIALVTFSVLCLPLALFTVKFGRANLAQSVGSNTKLIMANYEALPRWSLAAWTFYPRLAWPLLNPFVITLTLGALALAIARRHFLRANSVALGWFLLAYLTFSFYDNRLARHATFWWPAWIMLAAACLDALMRATPRRWNTAWPVLLLLPVPWQMRQTWRTDVTDYQQVQAPVAALFAHGNPGNMLLFGQDKQVIVALVREHDSSQTVHLVRGERLLATGTLSDICRRYRIGTVVVELPESEALDRQPYSAGLSSLQPMQQGVFFRRGTPVRLLSFAYNGPMDPTMANVPLSNDLL
jgi:hypothetical protein